MTEIPMDPPGIPGAPGSALGTPDGPLAGSGGPGAPDEILVAFAEPAEQRRLTVLVRIILAIPHLIVLYVLSIASEVVALICWFAALFTGRLPAGLADFQVGYLRWLTRFSAYLFLLTDVYPPFEFAEAQYPSGCGRSRASSTGSPSCSGSSWSSPRPLSVRSWATA